MGTKKKSHIRTSKKGKKFVAGKGRFQISYNTSPQLPVYKIKGKFYFRDARLGEYRNVKNFNDRISINDVTLEDLQKPTRADTEKII